MQGDRGSTRTKLGRNARGSSRAQVRRVPHGARARGHEARAFTRNRLDWSDYYAPVVEAASKLRCRSAVIDGEVVVLDGDGRSDFHAVKTAIALGGRGLVFIAFDLMFLDGKDLRTLTIEDRRAELRQLIPRSLKSRLQFSEAIAGDGPKVFASAEQLGLEGMQRLDPELSQRDRPLQSHENGFKRDPSD